MVSREEDTTYPLGHDLEKLYKSRCAKPCANYREQERKKNDCMKMVMQKLNHLRGIVPNSDVKYSPLSEKRSKKLSIV